MDLILIFALFVIAVLYGSVGLGGGTGYLAVLSLAGLPPEMIRPAVLMLNVLVAGLGTYKYVRAGHFSARLFWPIALISFPFAFLGGRISLPAEIYNPVVGLMLIYAAFRLWQSTLAGQSVPEASRRLPVWLTLIAGAAIGFVAGLTGNGGGIFLGPVLLLSGWANTKQALGITAAYVLVNSLAGLAGRFSSVPALPPNIGWWLVAAGIGGWLGAEFGSRRLDPRILRRLLALILLTGGLRALLTLWPW